MGQKHWAWGCALIVVMASAHWLAADEKKADDPFAASKS
jgi:hypothetical protein